MLNLNILSENGLAIRVCTNAKRKIDIERLTNIKSWCGTENGWKLDEKMSKELGQAQVPCTRNSERIHYILYA